MRAKSWALVVACALSFAACGHARSTPVDPARSDEEREIIAAQVAQINANNLADIVALDALTAQEYVGINARGLVQTKAEFLEDVRARGAAAIKVTPEQLGERQKTWKVRLYGGAGVVTRLTAGDHGVRSWVTAIWVKREGRWIRAFSQVTTATNE